MKTTRRSKSSRPAQSPKTATATREVVGSPSALLEEELNFSNVTEFRKSILEIIPRLQENHLLRFVITKHGEPVATVMSYEAYGVLKRIATRILDKNASSGPEVVARSAYQRMTGTEPPAGSSQESPSEVFDVSLKEGIPNPVLNKMHKMLQDAVRHTVEKFQAGASNDAEYDIKISSKNQ